MQSHGGNEWESTTAREKNDSAARFGSYERQCALCVNRRLQRNRQISLTTTTPTHPLHTYTFRQWCIVPYQCSSPLDDVINAASLELAPLRIHTAILVKRLFVHFMAWVIRIFSIIHLYRIKIKDTDQLSRINVVSLQNNGGFRAAHFTETVPYIQFRQRESVECFGLI